MASAGLISSIFHKKALTSTLLLNRMDSLGGCQKITFAQSKRIEANEWRT